MKYVGMFMLYVTLSVDAAQAAAKELSHQEDAIIHVQPTIRTAMVSNGLLPFVTLMVGHGINPDDVFAKKGQGAFTALKKKSDVVVRESIENMHETADDSDDERHGFVIGSTVKS